MTGAGNPFGQLGLNDSNLHLAAGETLFQQGDLSDRAYIVESGLVEVVAKTGESEVVLARLGPGEVVGEMGLIAGSGRSATIRALSDSELLVISAEQLRYKLRDADPVVALLLETLLRRLRDIQGGSPNANPCEPAPAGNLDHRPMLDPHEAKSVLRTERRLLDAVKSGELEVAYQPIVHLSDGRLAGFEALARWHHPELGNVAPNHFVPLAERAGLIGAVDRSTFDQAFAFARDLLAAQGADGGKPFVSVNLSAVRFDEEDLVSHIEGGLRRSGAEPEQIKIELTESVLLANPTRVAEILTGLKAIGVRSVLDDFGTGYSSLSYLHSFPIDGIKIDAAFIRSLLSNSNSYKITRAIAQLAGALELEIIAEGIESDQEVEVLRQLGCHMGQGYLFGRPMAPEAAIERIPVL